MTRADEPSSTSRPGEGSIDQRDDELTITHHLDRAATAERAGGPPIDVRSLDLAGDAVIVTDLGSSGGTRVNGDEISGPSVLHHGDTVSFGPVPAQFEDPAAAAEAEEATMVFEVPKVDTGPHLSPRQQQVLELMAEGMTNAEIGDQLGVTERTVKAYAQELYDKLGVRNRAGAVAEAHKIGLL